MANFQKRMMDLARYVSTWSKSETRSVGCVITNSDDILISVGYNGFPQGLKENIAERQEKPKKYMYTVHAEIDAICNSSKLGISLNGCIMYSTLFPCNECAKAIIKSGIKKLITREPDFNDEQWGESFKVSYEMLKECRVEIIYYVD